MICSEIYNNFDFYEDQLKLSHHTNISRHEYLNKMVHGNQWATSTEISVATRILQSIINIWLQGRDGQNNICFTKEEYINSSLSRNVDLLLHQNHFKLFIKNSMEQNGYQFHSTRIAKDLNILYDFFLANKHTFSLQLNSQREITPVK